MIELGLPAPTAADFTFYWSCCLCFLDGRCTFVNRTIGVENWVYYLCDPTTTTTCVVPFTNRLQSPSGWCRPIHSLLQLCRDCVHFHFIPFHHLRYRCGN